MAWRQRTLSYRQTFWYRPRRSSPGSRIINALATICSDANLVRARSPKSRKACTHLRDKKFKFLFTFSIFIRFFQFWILKKTKKKQVAIKVIDKKKAKEDAYVSKNMRREGKLLQMIIHPNIIQLYELMETENRFGNVIILKCRP